MNVPAASTDIGAVGSRVGIYVIGLLTIVVLIVLRRAGDGGSRGALVALNMVVHYIKILCSNLRGSTLSGSLALVSDCSGLSLTTYMGTGCRPLTDSFTLSIQT